MKVLQYICRVIQSVSMATIPVKATGSANQTFLPQCHIKSFYLVKYDLTFILRDASDHRGV